MRKTRDKISQKTIRLFAILAIIFLIGIIIMLCYKSYPILSLNSFWHCLKSSNWHPRSGEFGLWPFLFGTIAVTIVATLIAVPLSLLSAFYLSEYTKNNLFYSFVIDILAAIPSVIYGLFGVLCIVPLVRQISSLLGGHSSGYSWLSASLVLAIMICPIIIAVSYEILRNLPLELRESAYALGASKSETNFLVIFKIAFPGLISGIMLSVSRAIGETMAIMMVAGNVQNVSLNIFKPIYTLPSLIANNYGEMLSIPLYDSALMLAALVLLILAALINCSAHLYLANFKSHV